MTLRAYAEVNHGRWIVKCPACPCAEHLNGPGFDGKQFRCTECKVGPLAVEWPAERAAIEKHLSRRPVENQSWLPTESVADLVRENIEYGVK